MGSEKRGIGHRIDPPLALRANNRSFSVRYIPAMVRLVLLLPLTVAACTVRADTAPPSAAAARPEVLKVRPTPTPELRGRWIVTQVNGRPEAGLWLELGGEGVATITRSGSAIYVGSPQPPTEAFLGCNLWRPSGWTREGGKLILGREMSTRTERGCDEASEALDDEAYAILTKPMTMEFIPPNRLRLRNETGSLELVRKAAAAESPPTSASYP